MSHATKTLRSIELFAGCGGLALGSARAGFQHDRVIDLNDYAHKTLTRNKQGGVQHVKDWDIGNDDLTTYDFSRHSGDVDFVFGGPPCQPFSLGGKHKGHRDDRNMFPHAVRAVREIQPSAFVFENVKGLLREGFARYYAYIIEQFRFPDVVIAPGEDWVRHFARLRRLRANEPTAAKYSVEFKLLDAANHGIPQRRERVFIMGIRSDVGAHPDFPEETHSKEALLHDKWVTGEYWERHRIPKNRRPTQPPALKARISDLNRSRGIKLSPWKTVRDATSDLPRLSAGQTSKKIHNHFLNPGARSYAGHTGSPHDEPAKALKAGDHGVPGGENMLRRDDGTVRYFSVRECARLQTFPDDWRFEGAWTEAMRQLGNAVPVLLAEAVAGKLWKLVDNRTSERRPQASQLEFDSAREFAAAS